MGPFSLFSFFFLPSRPVQVHVHVLSRPHSQPTFKPTLLKSSPLPPLCYSYSLRTLVNLRMSFT